ncbi:MAG: hypothetical protein ACKVH0_04525 [Alphaproteobacteria bacterium]
MSALAHEFEAAGIPTTLIALVREHAEAIKPPRSLWVPFELGRPVGAPEDAAFQRRVIHAALGLLERPSGPVLEDYPEEAPTDADTSETDEGWACPVSFAAPATVGDESFAGRLAHEVAQLKPWHETWKRRKGASGMGAAGADIDALAAFIGGFADGDNAPSPVPEATMADAMKLSVNDLMTFYQEAANAQPGAAGDSQQVSDWFWGETVAGQTLLQVRKRGAAGDDKRLAFVVSRLLLPHVAASYGD